MQLITNVLREVKTDWCCGRQPACGRVFRTGAPRRARGPDHVERASPLTSERFRGNGGSVKGGPGAPSQGFCVERTIESKYSRARSARPTPNCIVSRTSCLSAANSTFPSGLRSSGYAMNHRPANNTVGAALRRDGFLHGLHRGINPLLQRDVRCPVSGSDACAPIRPTQ
jgi:hypothetical protein